MRHFLATTLLALSCAAFAQNAKTDAKALPTQPPAPKPGDIVQNAVSLAAQAPAAKPEDVKSPEAIVAACYDVISGAPGDRNWDRFRSLFAPSARLTASVETPDGKHIVQLLNVEQYAQHAGAYFQKTGFYEHGIHNEMQRFGNVAQIFTSYESRHSPAEVPFEHGINSFQVLYDGQRWWVVSILWDEERKDNPLPAGMVNSNK